MFVHSEVTYGFNMPDEYDELKQFEADTDLTKDGLRWLGNRMHLTIREAD